MKRAIIIGCTILSLLAAGCSTQTPKQSAKPSNAKTSESQQNAAKEPQGSNSNKKDFAYEGVVDRLDLNKKTVVIRKEDSNLAIEFDASKTKLTGYSGLNNVKRDDKVVVKYKVESGKAHAVALEKR